MGEIRTGSAERLRNRRLGRGTTIAEHVGQGDVEREDGDDVGQIAYRDRLVERHTDPVSVYHPQVDVPGPRRIENPGQIGRLHLDADGVEEVLMDQVVPQAVQGRREVGRLGVDPLGDPAEAIRAVVDRVHARHHGEEYLRRADIAGGFVAPDVLFPSLQGHA